MAATINDVAELANLSVGTVSKYLNGISVKEKSRVEIEKAIKLLNYKPNNIAKGLRNAKTFTVAVLVPMLSSIFCTTVISAIEKYLLTKDYCVIVSECHDNAEMEIKKTKFLLSRLVDGIILLPFSTKGIQYDLMKQENTPVVVIDQLLSNHKTDGIVLDNEQATFEPVEKLIQMGHEKIAIITGDPELYTTKGRLKGFKKALQKYDLSINNKYIMNGHYNLAGGYQAIIDLYKLKDLPTAILISNYEMTVGGFLAINYLKLKVPDDVSVIGFDNLLLSQVVNPSLSVIEQPMEEMGTNAAKLLYNRMQGDYSDFPKVIIHKANYSIKDSVKSI